MSKSPCDFEEVEVPKLRYVINWIPPIEDPADGRGYGNADTGHNEPANGASDAPRDGPLNSGVEKGGGDDDCGGAASKFRLSETD